MKKVALIEKRLPASTRTAAGLRDALFDELDALRAGHSTPMRAGATAKLAGQIIAAAKMEISSVRTTVYAKNGGGKSLPFFKNAHMIQA